MFLGITAHNCPQDGQGSVPMCGDNHPQGGQGSVPMCKLAVLLEKIAHRVDRILFPCVRTVLNHVCFKFGVPWEKGTRTQYHTLAEFKVFVNSVHSFSLNISILKASRNTISKGNVIPLTPMLTHIPFLRMDYGGEASSQQCPHGVSATCVPVTLKD